MTKGDHFLINFYVTKRMKRADEGDDQNEKSKEDKIS